MRMSSKNPNETVKAGQSRLRGHYSIHMLMGDVGLIFLTCTSNALLIRRADLARENLADEWSENHHPEVHCNVAAAIAMVDESFARVGDIKHCNTQPNILEDLDVECAFVHTWF